jgi:hypothetical protein
MMTLAGIGAERIVQRSVIRLLDNIANYLRQPHVNAAMRGLWRSAADAGVG